MKKILLFFAFAMCILQPCLALDGTFEPTADQMIGQMIIIGFNGDNINSKGYKQTLKQLEADKIGGVVLFGRNIKDKMTLAQLNNGFKNANSSFKPLISIDQEGGYVTRLHETKGFKEYISAAKIAKDTQDLAYLRYFAMASDLKKLGFNLNFAPCVDLDLNPDSIIHKKERSFSSSPNTVELYAKELLKAHNENGVATSLKHFPGHGSVKGDTHMGFVDATSTWTEQEIQPYKNLVNLYPNEMVMVSHIYNKNIDTDFPASLSHKTISGLLRNELNFDGVAITDDLNMGAIKNNYDLEDTVINAINAGNDILLFSNGSNKDKYDENLPDKIIYIVKNALIEGKIQWYRVQESYERIIKLKSTLN